MKNKIIGRRAALALPTLAVLGAAGAARAQADYPNRPLRIVVPYTPGGTTDIVTRLVAEPLSRALGQPVVVENRPGANSIVGAGAVAASPPDGYTLVMVIGAHAANATLYQGRLPFDAVTSFAPVSHAVNMPLVLGVNARLPIRNFQEFLAYARARPGQVNYGSSGIGAAAHLTMEDLQAKLGLRLVHVPYRGTQPALQDLMAGNIGVMFDSFSTLKPPADAGGIRLIGIAAAQRPAFAPDLPTLNESGAPGFVSNSWAILMGPAGMPRPIVERLSTEMDKLLRDPAINARLQQLGFEVTGGTPAAAESFLRAEITRWAGVIRAANVVVE